MKNRIFRMLTICLAIAVIGLVGVVGVQAAMKEIPLSLSVNMTTNVKTKVALQVDGMAYGSTDTTTFTMIFDNASDTPTNPYLSGNTISLTSVDPYTSSTEFTLRVYNFSTSHTLTPKLFVDTEKSDAGISIENLKYNVTTIVVDNSPTETFQSTPYAIPIYSQQGAEVYTDIKFNIQSLFQNKKAVISLLLEGNS